LNFNFSGNDKGSRKDNVKPSGFYGFGNSICMKARKKLVASKMYICFVWPLPLKNEITLSKNNPHTGLGCAIVVCDSSKE
jgi:hypothetical protein